MTVISITLATTTPTVTADAKPPVISAALYDSKCAGAWQQVRTYRARYNHHRATMHASLAPPVEQAMGCKRLKQRARYWRHAANTNRKAAARYHAYHYNWWEWMPDKYARVGACETGYGKRPGRWDWDSGTYVSAFGIIRGAYNDFSRRLGYRGWDEGGRTPRQQYEVAAAIQARYGWSAWGCGAA